MTSKAEPGGPVEAEAFALDVESIEEIKLSAETYRARKEAAPEVSTASKAAQLHQAAANLEYYTRLAQEQRALIKQLTAELNAAGSDADLTAIASIVNKK